MNTESNISSQRMLAIGAGRFCYGAGAVQDLPRECDRLGGRPYVLGTEGSIGRALGWLDTVPARVGLGAYRGECTRQVAREYAEHARTAGATVIVGTGGGRILDLAKAVATVANLPIVTVPTSLATCAASSSVCIMYDTDGRPDGAIRMSREVDTVIADSRILGAAPRRLTLSGVLDSLAKLPELEHPSRERALAGSVTKAAAIALAQAAHRFCTESLSRLVQEDPDEKFLVDVAINNLLITSNISGLSAGLGQLALAHALYDFTRARFPRPSIRLLHGEIVGIGVVIQIAFNNGDPTDLRRTLRSLRIEPSLKAITPNFTQSDIDAYIRFCIDKNVISHNQARRFVESMSAAGVY